MADQNPYLFPIGWKWAQETSNALANDHQLQWEILVLCNSVKRMYDQSSTQNANSSVFNQTALYRNLSYMCMAITSLTSPLQAPCLCTIASRIEPMVITGQTCCLDFCCLKMEWVIEKKGEQLWRNLQRARTTVGEYGNPENTWTGVAQYCAVLH